MNTVKLRILLLVILILLVASACVNIGEITPCPEGWGCYVVLP